MSPPDPVSRPPFPKYPFLVSRFSFPVLRFSNLHPRPRFQVLVAPAQQAAISTLPKLTVTLTTALLTQPLDSISSPLKPTPHSAFFYLPHRAPTINMCIIFHASFANCQHKDFLGSYHCGRDPGCTIEAQHILDVEDAGFPCEMCLLLDKTELRPVEYYPPVPDIRLAMVKQPGWAWPKIVVVGEGGGVDLTGPRESRSCRGSCAGSLSDVDSVTSYWRLDPAGKAEYKRAQNGYEEDGHGIDSSSDDTTVPASFIRSPMRHADSPASTFGISPNTAKHRNLVQDQLAALPIPDPFPTRPFAESPQRMTTPALRATFQPTFEPLLPAGLPSYPVLAPGLINNYPAYPPGLTGEKYPMHNGSPTRAGQMMGSEHLPGLRVGPGPPPLTGEHFPDLHGATSAHSTPVHRRSPVKHTPATRPNLIFGGQGGSANASANSVFNVMPTAPYGMGMSTSATASGNASSFNMGAPFNDPARYGTASPLNMGANMSGFAFNPLAPQFTGTPKGKAKAGWSPRKDGF
ncbi:hypothetical protein NX059_006550 [Plenodomus lindquistii]|nr:hypothetical protein NX059_006550 [Plenodomus lindquistii]